VKLTAYFEKHQHLLTFPNMKLAEKIGVEKIRDAECIRNQMGPNEGLGEARTASPRAIEAYDDMIRSMNNEQSSLV
jgi:hypothetical protein